MQAQQERQQAEAQALQHGLQAMSLRSPSSHRLQGTDAFSAIGAYLQPSDPLSVGASPCYTGAFVQPLVREPHAALAAHDHQASGQWCQLCRHPCTAICVGCQCQLVNFPELQVHICEDSKTPKVCHLCRQ